MLIYDDTYKTAEELVKISEHNANHLEDRALALWQDLNECTINITKTKDVQEFILNLFGDIN